MLAQFAASDKDLCVLDHLMRFIIHEIKKGFLETAMKNL